MAETNLKKVRLEKGYTIEQVSSALKIRKQYIIALEEGDDEKLPGEAYSRGYAKSYCDFLRIPFPKETMQEAIEPKAAEDTSQLNKYLVVSICLLLLLVLVVLYYKHESFEEETLEEITDNLYIDESNNVIFKRPDYEN